MGLDFYYLGLPAESEYLTKFRQDSNLAESILQALVMDVWISTNFKHPLRKEIENAYPEIDNWRYQPTWRGNTAWAMIDAIQRDIGSEYPSTKIGERIILGDEQFLNHEDDLQLANLFRITSPSVVKRYGEFLQSYKIAPDYEQYAIDELSEYFQRIASFGNMSIISMYL